VLDVALNEIEDIVRSRPLLLMEIQEMVREAAANKDGLTGLSLRSLLTLGHGELRTEFDEGVASIEEHCQRYPYRVEAAKDGEKVVTETRTIELTLKITPIVTTVERVKGLGKGRTTKGTLEITSYEILGQVKSAKPNYRSRPVRALPRGGKIQFNPENSESPLQEVLDFEQDSDD
jgi:hypothetical protein